MILSVCLSPSVDITVEVDSLNVGKLNVVKSKSQSYSGKGINVGIGAARLGAPSFVTGFMYENNGSLFERALRLEGVPCQFVWSSGNVRENYKFIDNKSMLTEVNDVGATVKSGEQDRLVKMVKNLSGNSSATVISGSLPQGVDASYYKRLFDAVNPANYKVADASGERLLAALSAGVDLVKPNKAELEYLTKTEMNSNKEYLAGCYSLIDKGASVVLLSLGKRGAIITNGTDSYYCVSINVAVNSTVGAGDAMLASATVALVDGGDLREILRSGVAAGTATVTTYGTNSFAKDKYDEIYKSLTIEKL